jgi:hypothetical protein
MVPLFKGISKNKISQCCLSSIQRRSSSQKMNLIDFSNFHVPARLIAQSPATPRDSSRLMVILCAILITIESNSLFEWRPHE